MQSGLNGAVGRIGNRLPTVKRESQRLEAQQVERAYSPHPEPPVLRVAAIAVCCRRAKLFIYCVQNNPTYDGCSVFRTYFSVVLPIAILFLSLQKYFVKGMTVGAVKG